MLKSHSRIETENGIASAQKWVNLTMTAIKPFPTQRNDSKSTERYEFDTIFEKSRFIRAHWIIRMFRFLFISRMLDSQLNATNMRIKYICLC